MAKSARSIQRIIDRAAKAAAHLELFDLRMMNCSCGLSFPAIAAGPTNLPPVLNQVIRLTAARNNVPPNGQIVYMITLAILVPPGQSEAPADAPLHIDATFWLAFSILDKRNLSDADIQAFGQMNGMMQVWPYWREALQSFSTRMGLPAIRTSLRPPITPFQAESEPPKEFRHHPVNPRAPAESRGKQ